MGSQLATALLREGLIVRMLATGHSMSPFIREGDTLEIAPGTGCHFGDVVAVETEGRLLVHRVVRTSPLSTRGDVGEAPDALVAPSILGRVATVSRGARRVRLGLGPERIAIAWASRLGLLRQLALLRERLSRA